MHDFRNLNLDVTYRSDAAGIVKAFYVPCMRSSELYRRAVGYFTSHGLALAAQGIAHLLKSGGRIQLIASPVLSPDDVEAINRGYEQRRQILHTVASRALQSVVDELERDRLNALAWLISAKCMDVKLAIAVDVAGRVRHALYHEKIGIFTDGRGDSIAFTGSSNETASGLSENFESIDVFWSWDDPQQRVQRKISDFQRLWDNSTSGLEVLDFTDATRDLLKQFQREKPPSDDPLEAVVLAAADPATPRLPATISLRDYQSAAIINWFRANGRGTFKMATGAGKTITALAAAAQLSERIGLQALIVICPYRHLVTQWARECAAFGIDPILAFQSRLHWVDDLSTCLYNVNSDASRFVCVITTNSTFASDSFQSKLPYFPRKTMIIADEVHNLGASHLRSVLPEAVRFRLALSATPERWFDEQGTEAIFDYFGGVLEPQFTLRDALRCGALVPYRYYPILVELTDSERDRYFDLSDRIAKIAHMESGEDEHAGLTALLAQRARLLGMAANKITALRELMSGRLGSTHTLFYCGDGTVESAVDSEERRHVELVAQVLGNELGYRVATYTAETPLDQREDLRAQLDSGQLQGLVAIRCLDEGVDIPSIRAAVILASSRNPRQFIQRRGRILRPHPGKDSAEIFDMVVTPPEQSAVTPIERRMLRNELVRFAEFSDLATNSGEARRNILELQKKYHLMDI